MQPDLAGATDQEVVQRARGGQEDASRRRPQLATLSLDGAPGATTPDRVEATQVQLSDKGETPLQEVEARELGSAIEQAIGKLRPEYRACLLLRHIEDR